MLQKWRRSGFSRSVVGTGSAWFIWNYSSITPRNTSNSPLERKERSRDRHLLTGWEWDSPSGFACGFFGRGTSIYVHILYAILHTCIGTPRGQNFVNETLQHHLEVMHELIQRDKNRANVIMWSLANEPASNDPRSKDYFESVAKWTRILDSTRPITFVTDQHPGDDYAVSFCQFQTLFRDQPPSLLPAPTHIWLAVCCLFSMYLMDCQWNLHQWGNQHFRWLAILTEGTL